MVKAPLPPNEEQRLEALRRYAILDTPPEIAFERLTRLAARLFNVPIALISLVDKDRQWFKSCYGLTPQQTARDISFCSHAILTNEIMLVPDARQDPRFADNPLVTDAPHIRFYAGAPLQTPDGFNVGTLCIKDIVPRQLSQEQLGMLADLAALAIDELELRRALLESDEAQKALADRTKELAAAYDQATVYARELNTKLVERKRIKEVLRQQARVFENIYDSVIWIDLEGRVIDCNPATEKMFGYTREELLGQPPRLWHRPEEPTELMAQIIDEVSQHGRWAGQVNFVRKDGTEGVCEVLAVPIHDEHGQHVVTIGISHDITEQKREEQELKQRAAQLALINDIGSQIAAVLQLDDVLNRAAQLVHQTFGYYHVALFLVDQDIARLKAIAGSYRAYFPTDHSQPLSQGIIGWVATHGDKIIANDVSLEPRYISLIAAYSQTRAELCLPIKVAEQTVGVLDIQSQYLNAFGENDVMAMATLTDQIAAAIENARLYQTLQLELSERRRVEAMLQENEVRNRALLDAIPDLMFRLSRDGVYLDFRAERNSDLLIPPEMIIGTKIYDTPMPPPVIEQIMTAIQETLETGLIQSIEYTLPMPGGERAFEARIVASGAAEVVAIVRNITERKRVELLERDRNQVLEMVSQNKPLKSVLTALIQLVERQYPELLGSILLLRDGLVYHGAAPSLPDHFTRLIDGLTFGDILGGEGMAVYRGETLIIPDIAAELDRSVYHKLALSYDLRAYWSTPILSSDGALLGIFTGYYRQPGSPTPPERQLVEMAGRLAGIAIEHHQLTDQLAYQAQHDALTGLPNRSLFEDRLQQAIALARRNGRLVGLLYVDLDHFKQINDTLGHAAGDVLLQQVSQRLKSCVREEDTVARMGGDEFTIILMDLENPQDAAQVAQRILETLKQPITVRGHQLVVTTSIGLSLYPADGDNAEELLRKADNALYRCKEQGKNTYQFFTPDIDRAVHAHIRLKYQLQNALERGELLLHYQPQFKVTNGVMVGLEALLRWNHPELGLVSPAQFIPLAEESGLIVPIGAWVLAEACGQNQIWQQAGYPPLRLAVNVSTLQFVRDDFVETVVQVLAQSGLEPKWLQLELTESLLMQNPQDAASKLERLRAMGVVIALDDFGTGYSSLTYLRQLPIDTLKIAQPFVREIGINFHNTPSDEAIITAVINLAHSLGMQVVAEGVETEQQLAFLRRVGCDEMQGFLFSRPLPAAEFEQLLAQEAERQVAM